MLTPQALFDISSAPDHPTLRRRLVAAANELGFGLISGVLIRGALASKSAWLMSIGNTPPAYLQAQQALEDTLRDPVMTTLQRQALPVAWNQATYVHAGAADLWDLQAPFGYCAGVACVLEESSHLEQFVLGVDGQEALPVEPVALQRLQAMMQLLTVHAQAAMHRLYTPPAVDAPGLTDRELQCLQWAADGREVWQIGRLVSISDAEVRRCQRSAAAKLGVRSVRAAMLKCIEGGLIGV